MTVVDSVSKRVYFVPTHTMVTVEEAARLFLHYVWKLHSLPKRVVLDRGPQFVASFTKELYRLLGIQLFSSTAWHPQTDVQMECINQELDQFLRLFVNERQDDWYDLLPIAEFQHNNHVHSATQQPPFLLDTGRIPCMGFKPSQVPSGLETVNEFTERMKSATEEAKSAIRKAQEDMTQYYNQRRTPAPVYKPGDRVYLDTSVSEVVTSPARTLQNRMPSGTVSLPSQVTSRNEAVAPSVQRRKAVCCSGRSYPRKETASPAATHYCRQRKRVGSGRNIK